MPEIAAEPFPFPWQPGKLALVVIDMQRDFIEPGGFGHSLGNDVTRLQAIVPTLRRLMDAFRAAGLPIVHTRECHSPDLADCPPATTMREANDRGYECLLVEDCTESYFPHFKAAAIEMIRAQGAIVGWTTRAGQVIGAITDR
jgi:nicotinamidase-related amidase